MSTLPTAVYVDGYNLYYGRLRGTGYKWLDLVSLFERVLHDQDPSARLERLRYFSAPALARFARHGSASVEAQQDYHNALLRQHAPMVSITLGRHAFNRGGDLLPRFLENGGFDRNDRVRVWNLEEKQTDVSLAIAMYRDACSGALGQIVLCSNDSDAAPALEAIRQDFPRIVIGIVAPRRPPVPGAREHRSTSSALSAHAHWTRHHLLDSELEGALLPSIVHTGRKPIRRPAHW